MNRLPLLAALLLLPTLSTAQTLGTVNGEPIDTAEYRRGLEARRALWGSLPTSDEDAEIRKDVWNDLVEAALVRQGARRLGIDASTIETPAADWFTGRARIELVAKAIAARLAPEARPSDAEALEIYRRERFSVRGTVAALIDSDTSGSDPRGERALVERLDLLMQRARALRSTIEPGDSLRDLASADPDLIIEELVGRDAWTPMYGAGRDSALAAAALTVPLGEISQPVRGARAVYLLQVTGRVVPGEAEFAAVRASYVEQIELYRRYTAFQTWLASEKERAVITGGAE